MEATAPPLRILQNCASTPALEDAADDELARAARAGDRGALETLTLRHRGRIYVFALSLVGRPEDAEDAAQETLVRAFRGLPGYEPRGQFRAWLLTIAANVCREQQRRRLRREASTADALPEPPAPPAGDLYQEEALRAAVRQAVSRLPAAYRGPVVLYYLEELPVAEVARVLGRSQAAVKVQLWRARGFLARELEGWLG